jgi:hypothetical protein
MEINETRGTRDWVELFEWKNLFPLALINVHIYCTGKAHLREALLLHEEALRVNRMCRELRESSLILHHIFIPP